MYNEILKGIVKLFDTNDMDDDQKEVRGKIPYYLSLVYGFEPVDIVKIVRVKIDSPRFNLVLVLGNSPSQSENDRYADIIVMDGVITKIVLFNLNAHMSSDEASKYHSFAWSCWNAIMTIAEMERNLLEPSLNSKHGALTDVIYYAPLLLITKAFDKVYDLIDDNTIAAVLTTFYHITVLPESITSTRRLLDELSIKDLLDNSMWVAADKDVYPSIRFTELEINNEKEEDSDEEDTTV